MKRRLYLVVAFGFALTPLLAVRGDIPPPPEVQKEIEAAPRISPPGRVATLSERAFTRTVRGGEAKIVIPRVIYDELVAAVAAKEGEAAPAAPKKGEGIPPLALIISGAALSFAVLYLIAKRPSYRAVGGAAIVLLVASAVFWSPSAEANAGPVAFQTSKVTIEVPAKGDEVVIYIKDAPKDAGETPKAP